MSSMGLAGFDAVVIRAGNPGPFTLSGTNSWIYGRDPAWLIDPGPAILAHLDALSEELDERGGLGAILLTHDHLDHAQGAAEMVLRFSPVPLAAARGTVSTLLADGDRLGPFEVFATPGHSPDHLTFITDDGIAFTGDAVLGEGSVFITAQMTAYLQALSRLRDRALRVLAPGHGPPVTDPHAKLTEYIEHRLAREAALVSALAAGRRTIHDLLDAVWPGVRPPLRAAAAATLDAHLERLQSQGLLPPGVERA
ncbi:MAG: MBL fold metallo-hydrolase [Solirubrobacteraceae bacterium]